MSFFKQFPKTLADIHRDGVVDRVTDIFRYVDVIDEFADDSLAYKNVRVPNGMRPDQLSYQLYGTPSFYWTFFILNDNLKGGLDEWSKDDYELDQYIKNSYKNLSVFLFPPFDDPDQSDSFSLIDGMPINDPKFKDRLFMAHRLSSGGEEYAAVKVVYWDQSRYQLWVDSSKIYLYEPGNDPDEIEVAADGAYYSDIFWNTASNPTHQFNIFLVDRLDHPDSDISDIDSDDSQVMSSLVSDWETALDALPNFDDSQVENDVYAYYYYTDAQNAPYQYYSDTAKTDPITAYDSLVTNETAIEAADKYTSFLQHEEEENDAKRILRVVRPDRVRQFASEFKGLLNQ